MIAWNMYSKLYSWCMIEAMCGCNVGGRSWRARRVDLIVAPASQYYYALVGWTGSKHFNRSLRLYAQRRLGQRLTSHCLYDPATVCLVTVTYLDLM